MKLILKKEWSTHLPMLIKSIMEIKGDVMELGAGIFSTPVLHWLCLGRKLTTYEDNEDYYNFAKRFRSKNHQIKLVNNWDKIKFKKHYSVVLIDHSAKRRKIDVIKLKDKVDYIVLHDSNGDAYGYDEVFKHFKYRYDWKYCKPWTTVLSNFNNFEKWN